MRPSILVALAAIVASTPRPAPAQGVDFVKENYTKYEYPIPMRDGVKLFTSVYVPKDRSRSYPILLNRTPYSVAPYGDGKVKSDLGPSPLFGESKYIFAYQDVRGRWMSEGTFVNMRPQQAAKGEAGGIDESTDTYDTIAWLLDNLPEDNGKVGQWGISYPGFYTAAGMIDAHPALVASSPQAPIVDWFVGDDWHHNGALMLPHAFNFMANFGRPRPAPTTKGGTPFDHGTPDGYDFFLKMGPLPNADAKYFKGDVAYWNEVLDHPNYDAFWKARNLRPHLKAVKPAVLVVGGWFDAENLFGALECYRATEEQSPGGINTLVMGPWVHGGWSRSDGDSLGAVRFDAKTAQHYRETIEFPFFERLLKGADLPEPAEAEVFETGTNRWRSFDDWPPPGLEERSYYLRAGHRLGPDKPSEGDDAADTFVSDPARPVPFIPGTAIGMAREYMVEDQRFAARRPDVLVYETEPLDADLTIAGPIRVDLGVATTETDADWVVKVIDVYPPDYPDPEPNPAGVKLGGYQQLVRGDVFRGRFRKSFERPEAFVPGEPAEVGFAMPDVLHTFRRGHRLMVQIQSSWFPLVDRNPQTFVNINKAGESDFKAATHTVYRSTDRPSRVTVGFLP